MSLSLPGPAGGTDGGVLRDQALHSLLRDMITRVDTWFPRYAGSVLRAASRAQPVLRVDFTPRTFSGTESVAGPEAALTAARTTTASRRSSRHRSRRALS
eukprot:COSAG01_NODE_332_length_18712_cov_41.424358_9_plen_100_part_00